MNKPQQLFCLFLATGLLSCGDVNVNIGNSAPAAEEAPKTESPAAEQAPAQPAETLPVIKAKAGSQRIMDWGTKPKEELEGPTDPWVWDSWFCQGPNEDGLKASSTLAPQGKFNYKVSNMGDNDPTTAWVEGHADYGIGEYVEFNDLGIGHDSEVNILNGYQASRSSWENNSRVKQLKFSLGGKDYFILELADAMGTQSFALPKDFDQALTKANGKGAKIRITIMDVYPGLKWKDTAISEIFRCLSNPN